MRLGPQRSVAWPYKVTVGSGDELALSTDAVTNHLALEYLTEAELERINGLIRSAASMFESYTRRTLLTKTYQTIRTMFPTCSGIELLKSPFVSLVSFEYLVDGVYTAVDPTIYTIVQGVYYDTIVLNNNQSWPSTECAPNLIRIVFTAGVGIGDEEICDSEEPWVQAALQGLLLHVSNMNENRGDCGGGCSV